LSLDAEHRLIVTSHGSGFMYDGNGRRFRTYDGSNGNVVYYVYSYAGQLLTEDRITESTSNNYIYFNGQVVAIHQQNDSIRLLFKDHLGSTRKVVTVPHPNCRYEWEFSSTESYDYEPFGGSSSSGSPTRQMFQGKERNDDLDYYGARYYDGRQIDSGSAMRWISPDSITSRIYDPSSLNKYTYVGNDPVNMVDPDGRFQEGVAGSDSDDWYRFFLQFWEMQYNDLTYGPSGGGGGGGTSQPSSAPECGPDGYRDATPAEAAGILAAAEHYAGKGYDPTGKNQNGFDCTGLFLQVLTDLGYYSGNPETTTGNIPNLNIVRPLGSSEQLMAGDILLWSGHVGFYDPNPPPTDPNNSQITVPSNYNVFSAETHHGATWGDPTWWDPTWTGSGGSNTGRYVVRVPCKK
jgi:RHS repeat-associated protein